MNSEAPGQGHRKGKLDAIVASSAGRWLRGDSSLASLSSEFFGHADEVGEGFCFHLLHDVGAMKFDRSLGGSEFAGDLFIQHSRSNERHHFTFAWSKLLVALVQFRAFRS